MFRTVDQRTAVGSSGRIAGKRARKSSIDLPGMLGTQREKDANQTVKAVEKRGVMQLSIDVPLLLVVITLVIFGMIMVYSASYDFSLRNNGDSNFIFSRQMLWLALGLAGALFLTYMDYHYWRQLAVPAIIITIVALIGVLLVNEIRNNAARTLYEGSVQPSELAKLIIVIYLSVWLYARKDQLSDLSFGLVPLGIILGVLGSLILLQPDLSAVVTVIFLGGLMFFLAGGDLRQIGILLVMVMLVGVIAYKVYPTGKARIDDYILGLKDPTQGSYHVVRSFDAFVKGGWFGVGIGKSETKLTGLPVPHTDSIFAVVGEETGLVGSLAVVCLYSVFLWRGMVISRRAPDELGALLAAGLSLWIATEAFINMAVMVNILPFAGNALPLISAGGSNLTVTLAAVGILLNISRLSRQRRDDNGKSFHAVVSLRGRNGGRRVSGARRPANYAGRVSKRT